MPPIDLSTTVEKETALITASPAFRPLHPFVKDRISVKDVSIIAVADEVKALKQAEDAIAAKAASLGAAFTGASRSDVEWKGSAYERSYVNCTIFFSPATGAHEVHGDILAKYRSINGWAVLGAPVTDETTTPDGVGRYNHFSANGSLYWHPESGPMMVSGAVRDRWAAQAWEQGPLGYPVHDGFSPDAGEMAGDFQNGVVWTGPSGPEDAVVATLGPDELLTAIRSYFDKMVHESPDNIGLHPERSLDAVSATGYGFWQSRNRLDSIQIHGFHDNGLAPDTDFTAYLTLLFAAVMRDNGDRDVTVSLTAGHVQASGLGSQSVSDGVSSAMGDAFKQPIVLGTIPKAAPLLSLKVDRNGGLSAYLSPTPTGRIARNLIQQAMEAIGQ